MVEEGAGSYFGWLRSLKAYFLALHLGPRATRPPKTLYTSKFRPFGPPASISYILRRRNPPSRGLVAVFSHKFWQIEACYNPYYPRIHEPFEANGMRIRLHPPHDSSCLLNCGDLTCLSLKLQTPANKSECIIHRKVDIMEQVRTACAAKSRTTLHLTPW